MDYPSTLRRHRIATKFNEDHYLRKNPTTKTNPMLRQIRLLTTAATISLVALVQSAKAEIDTSLAPIYVDARNPSVFALKGEIDSRTSFNFKRAISRYGVPRELLLDSPGGQVHEGLVLAMEVRELGLRTNVIGGCYSACFFVYVAGREREINGSLGVHQMSSERNDFSLGQTAIADMIDVLKEFDVDQGVLVLMLQTPPGDMHIFSRDEIARFGLESGSPASTVRFSNRPMPDAGALLDEALRFVAEHNRLWSQDNRFALTELQNTYAPLVDFYGSDWSRAQVMDEKAAFATRWPIRDYEFRPAVRDSFCDSNGDCLVIGEVDWHASSPARGSTSTGTASVRIGLKKIGAGFQITSEHGEVLARRVTRQ